MNDKKGKNGKYKKRTKGWNGTSIPRFKWWYYETKEYKYIEYTDDDDFVIANVVMDGDKIVSVKLTESCLTNRTEYIELTTFMNTIAPMPWKYDDNDQACDDWYKGHTEIPSPDCISDIAKITMI